MRNFVLISRKNERTFKSMEKSCQTCRKIFKIVDADQKIYRKIQIPSPKNCPDCRVRRRLQFRNERNLFRGECSSCGTKIISMFDPARQKVWCGECWWGDGWDARDFAQDFDFSRPFFPQFFELFQKVPKFNLQNRSQENCGFCNFGVSNKNSYLCFSNGYCEEMWFSETCLGSKNCVDCTRTDRSELCFECADCQNCFHLKFARNCRQCRDSWFLDGCQNCKNCFGCTDLEHAEYHIFNKKYSRLEFEEFIAGFDSGRFSILDRMRRDFDRFCEENVLRSDRNLATENCTGTGLRHCKNCKNCTDCLSGEDCKFCAMAFKIRDSFDANFSVGELLHEVVGTDGFEIRFCNWATGRNIEYSMFCDRGDHIFGCVGLRGAKFHIFNREFPENEYFRLRDRIIEHMRHTGEWGEFFPTKFSPHDFENSVAGEFFPKFESKESVKFESRLENLPDSIEETPDAILDEICHCSCQKKYKIQPGELKIYRKWDLPVPRSCPKCRYLRRLEWRRPSFKSV